MVLRQLLHGAHRGQPKTSRRPGVETLHGPVFATPALRATVDEPVEEIPGETPSSRIAFGDPDNTTFREIERTKKYVVLELVTGGFYAEPQGDRHRRPALLHGPEQIADLPVPVAESPGAVRIGHPERSHLVEYLAPNSVFNSLPRQRSSPHLRPDDRLVTIDRVLHHASLGVA